jgi:glycerol-3-phosphate dehydrogenase
MRIDFDLLVVGGGINGSAIARDAAGRGARVLLVEQDDLAAHTSSASTKLIHGGLRYLEHFEFRLVAEALAERERLMAAAPHLIRPLRFVLPHDRSMRPGWMISLGLLLYDHLGGRRRLPASAGVRLDAPPYAGQLRPQFPRGFVYSDCWGDDSRLVVANAKDAERRGAKVLTRTRLLAARRTAGGWTAELQDRRSGRRWGAGAKALANATGSWAAEVLHDVLGLGRAAPLRLVKGSHIVTRRLYDGDHAYILQNPDRRIVFAIPYEGRFTLIGTTDVPWSGALDQVEVDEAEVEYLCGSVNRYFAGQISPADVIWRYAGLRPLYDDDEDDPSAISRDYVLEVDRGAGAAPVLSVFGGKITTHRALAETALEKLAPDLPGLGPAWTGRARLPGGDVPDLDLSRLVSDLRARAPFLPPAMARRWVEAYGALAFRVLGSATSLADLGRDFGAGLTEAEVDYLRREEWAVSAEDILWRRSKLGLHISVAGAQALAEHVEQRPAADPASGARLRSGAIT